jgi:Protein of unknown function (DUF2752)
MGASAPLGRALRLAAVGAVFAFAAALHIPICPIAILTGWPCPGCGITRATLALMQGHLHEAVALHPLAPLISPLVVGFLGYGAIVYVREGRWPANGGRAAGWVGGAGVVLWALLVGVWLARFWGAFGGPVAV